MPIDAMRIMSFQPMQGQNVSSTLYGHKTFNSFSLLAHGKTSLGGLNLKASNFTNKLIATNNVAAKNMERLLANSTKLRPAVIKQNHTTTAT